MQSPDLAIRELERCVRELGLAGVQIGSNVNGANLDSPELFPILEAAASLERRRLRPPVGDGRPGADDEVLAPLARRDARGNVARDLLAHLRRRARAAASPADRVRARRRRVPGDDRAHRPRLRRRGPICAPSPTTFRRANICERIYVDSLVHDPLMLRYLVDLMGADRIALGSDYPFPLGEARPGELIDSCGFPEETRARLLHGTALEWLDLPAGALRRSPVNETVRVRTRLRGRAGSRRSARARFRDEFHVPDAARTARTRSTSPAIRSGSSRGEPPGTSTRSWRSGAGSRVKAHFSGAEPVDAVPRAARGADGASGGRRPERSRDDELAHRQSSPDDDELLPAHAASGTGFSSRITRSPRTTTPLESQAALPRVRPGFEPSSSAARSRKAAIDDRGHRPGPRARRRVDRPRPAPGSPVLHGPGLRHRERSRGSRTRRDASSASTWRTRRAIWSCASTTGTWTSPSGARTST